MRFTFAVLLLVAVSYSTASAGVCTSGTLQDYLNMSLAGCALDDKTFSSFLVPSGSSFATPIDPTAIQVTPLDTLLNPGFTFTFNTTATAGNTWESLVFFSIAVNPGGSPIGGASLEMSGSDVTPDGVNTALLCLAVPDAFGSCSPTVLSNFDIGFISQLTDSLGIAPVTHLDVLSDVVIDGGLEGSASLSSVTMRFQEVPEPALWFPVGLGLLSFAVYRRRR